MSKSKIFLLVSLIFLLANFVWLFYFDSSKNQDFGYGKFYTFQAKIKNLDKKIDGWNIIIKPKNLENFSGYILVYVPLYPEYSYGDILEFSCKIYKPEPIVDEVGKVFFYDKYLAKDDIYASCYRPRISKISQEKDVAYYLFKTKNYFWSNLNVYLVEPASSFSKAILLASRREIQSELRDNFAKVGLSHMIAISGLHMAIIVWLLQIFLLGIGLSRKASFVFLLGILFIYLYLIGFPSSAVRASAMVIIVMLGPFLARSTNSVYSLLLVVDLFVLSNRYLLLYDIGFQLSFLAVLGLLFYVKFFSNVLFFIPRHFKIREVVAVTLSAQVFTWPLIIYYFNIFSIIAPLANLLILPLLPLVLFFSLLLALVGFLPWLADIVAWPLFVLLKIIVITAEYLSKIPYAYFVVNNFSVHLLIISFIFMIIITLILKPKNYE